ncbi:MAG TPA: HEAT repeat domain-containing protein [Planctomycetota bacterium]|nr:HEAT repeat domain-containing protein [Planctomycetota bacterium]
MDERLAKEIKNLQSHPVAQVRCDAAHLLSQSPDSTVLTAMIAALNDYDLGVRRAVCKSLGRVAHPAALVPLAWLVHAPTRGIQQVYGVSLEGAQPDPQALHELVTDAKNALKACARSVGSVRDVLDLEMPGITRALVVPALSFIEGEEAVELLAECLDNPAPAIRRAAATTLTHRKDGMSGVVLATVINDQDEDVRNTAQRFFFDKPTEAAVDGLGELLKHENVEIRQQAQMALGKVGSPSASAMNRRALLDEDPSICAVTIDSIDEIHDDALIARLRQRLTHEDPRHRIVAAIALGKVTGKYRDEALALSKLFGADPTARGAGLAYFHTHKSPIVVNQLFTLLQDNNPAVRKASALAINFYGAELGERLLKRLEIAGSDERLAVLEAMGRMTVRNSVPVLKGLMGHTLEPLRVAAAKVLAFQGQEGLDILQKNLTSVVWREGVSAVTGLAEVINAGLPSKANAIAQLQQVTKSVTIHEQVKNAAIEVLSKLGLYENPVERKQSKTRVQSLKDFGKG